jgi:hypothetical protein
MKKIIACGSMSPELEKLRKGHSEVDVSYLPQNLHRTPGKMKAYIQKIIDELNEGYETVILGYGLCSNGIVGVKAPEQGLYIPRVHDCIALYLGSRKAYQQIFKQHPGTYYLTKSWIMNKTDPLGLVENEYSRRVGREIAEETMQREIKNYDCISFVNTHTGHEDNYRERAWKNAEHFHKKFIEYNGSDVYFKKMLFGPYEVPDFVYVPPHDTVKQREFLK